MGQGTDSKEQAQTGAGGSGTAANGSGSTPRITLPKGGGAIKGIEEKYSVNPVTGSASLAIPIFTTPGRQDFSPKLSLSYDSGSGNGPFGFGWSLSIPSITRKTEKGLPRYRDEENSDVFILSGAEDLAPDLVEKNGEWDREDLPSRTVDGNEYKIQRYRPRVEGLFARIERWTNTNDREDVFWRSISRDNISTWYGRTTNSRIADPAAPEHIFSWLICESRDDKGNVILYTYEPENSDGVDLSQPNERNRERSANRYLKRVRYGNRTPWEQDFLFEVVFDYGEHDLDIDAAEDNGQRRQWDCRPDPFSSYRAGFEVRTYRLCRRVLMFHRFDELGRNPCLVRSTDLQYAHNWVSCYSYLTSATQTGYVWDQDHYRSKSLPPMDFTYSVAEIQNTVEVLDAESIENLPQGIDGRIYQWADLDGEGISGILTEQADAWYYKPNKGNGRFGPLRTVALKPSLAALGSGRQQLTDLAGDGQLDQVQFEGSPAGFYERTHDQEWEPFTSFVSLPNIDWNDPNLKFVDLTGDGHADILITEHDVFTWHRSLAEEGFAPAETVRQALDEEKGPRLVFADGTQSIYLADMSGDGLTDIARIGNGEVCYWPNLGYGRFGPKVTMDNAPHFDNTDQFNQAYVRLADIDGTGTTDIIYLGRNSVTCWFNRSGNGWGSAQTIAAFLSADNLSSVMVTDLLGKGTAALVWSSPSDSRRPLQYLDLMGEKPHLMKKIKNNMGKETVFQYANSTKFYLEDKENGKPWITRLPFPVHVVERMENYDWISRNRFVTRYAYHHGYYDGIEREFRGFGMVEQWDTEEFSTLSQSQEFPSGDNVDLFSHVPPVLTKTWFHTGAYLGREHVSDFFAGLLDANDIGEYYREPGLTDAEARQLLLDDTVLPDGLTVEEEREACRALKGQMLRQEVYALDGAEKEPHPYTVTEQNFAIRRLQPKENNQHGVFFTHAREAVSYHYERNPADPRISHAMTLEVNDYGNVLKSVAIGYGRRPGQSALEGDDKKKQEQILITYTENDVTADDPNYDDDNYRTPLPCEVRTYELTGLAPENGAQRFSFDELTRNSFDKILNLAEVPYEHPVDYSASRKRLIERVRTLYRANDLSRLLPLGELEYLALPGETYKLAFTPGLIETVYERDGQPLLPVPGDILSGTDGDKGGYVDLDNDGNWWIPSGRIFYSRNEADDESIDAENHFYLPRRFEDPFGNSAFVDYDSYDLLVAGTEDALQNRVSASNDYRVLQPKLITDPNNNRSAVDFDELGLVIATAVMGKENETDPEKMGDTLDDPTTRLEYDLFNWINNNQPNYVRTLAREKHRDPATRWQESYSYSDGFGREIQKKIQAEPGKVEVEDEVGNISIVDTTPEIRWVGSGWTIFNNKGKPVRQYEPFFSINHQFQFGKKVGVSPRLFYDPVERVVATLHPNHTYEKVVFDPWQQITYDVNDTVAANGDETGDPRTDADIKGSVAEYFKTQPDEWQTWRQERIAGAKGTQEQNAAEKAEQHANTPTVAHMDTLGRPFLTLAHNRFERNGVVVDEKYATRIELDIEGNQRTVIDAKDRIVMRYNYDMLGNRIQQLSMEAGERWILNDVTGKPIRAWDSRGFTRRMSYDELRRPTGLYATENGRERLAEQTIYGEGQGDVDNHCTRVYQVRDGAGIVTSVAYDFKGNLLEGRRELLPHYSVAVDWLQNPTPNDGSFTSYTTFDALNRPITVTTPDKSVYRPTFNEANLLDRVDVKLRGASMATAFVNNINYNAKGQRELIVYGNGVETNYEYDPQTFRLIHLKTTRLSGLNGPASKIFKHTTVIQDLRYTYDPAGNITRIEDAALSTVFYNGQQIDPVSNYTYDAIYRLIEAQGREHIGQTAFNFTPPSENYRDYPFKGIAAGFNDLQALRKYTERYEYDAVSNFDTLRHIANGGNWTRSYDYEEESFIEDDKKNNRLTRTSVGNGINSNEPYTHDAHGNMTSMPHLPNMIWDFEDQLQQVELGGGGRAYYVYDAGGQRARKVIESHDGTRQEERIYLGGFEIYREYGADGITKDLERESLHVMDDKQRIEIVETQTIESGDQIADPAPLQRFQLGNHLGSASLELTEDGELISYEEYHPYGTSSFQAGRSVAEVSLKRYRYTGKERDEESGLYYHGARYYAPWLGRWVSCDPLLITSKKPFCGSYEYVRNNPVHRADADGCLDDEARAILNYMQQIANKIPQEEFAELSRAEQGTRAHLGFESYLSMGGDIPSDVNIRRLAAEVQVDEEGIIRAVGVEPGAAKKGWRTIDAAVLKEYAMGMPGEGARGIIGVRASDVIEVGIDYKTGKATMEGVTEMERLIGGPYVKLEQNPKRGLDVLSRAEKKMAKLSAKVGRAETGTTKIAEQPLEKETGTVGKQIKRPATENQIAEEGAGLARNAAGADIPEKSVASDLSKLKGLRGTGTRLLKVVPYVGIGVGVASAKAELEQGNYISAGFDVFGLIPGAGDLLDLLRLAFEPTPAY